MKKIFFFCYLIKKNLRTNLMVSLEILDEFTIGITEYIDMVEKEINVFENNENPLGTLHNELLKLSETKKGILNLVLSLCFGDKTDKFIEQAYQKRISEYRQKRDNLTRKYQVEDILFVSERKNLEKMAAFYQNILFEFDKKESISELEELEKKLAYESLFHTRTNYVLMEQYDRKMRDMMMNEVPKCDSVSKITILGDLERLNVEDTIVSFLSYSRKISTVTIQKIKSQMKDFHLKTSLENDSNKNENSCLDNKKRKKNKKKKKKNQELSKIVKIQTILRKYWRRKAYQKIRSSTKIIQTFGRRFIYQQRYHQIKKSVQLIQRELTFRVIYLNFCSLKQQIVSHVQKTQLELKFLRKNKHELDSFKSQFIVLAQFKYQLLMVSFTGLINSSKTKDWIQKCDVMIQERHQKKRNFIMKHQILMIDPTLREHIISKCIQESTERVICLRKSNSKNKKINLEIDIQNNKIVYLKKKHKLLLKYHYLKQVINTKWGNIQEEQLSDVNRILRTLDCLELEDLCVSFDAFLQYTRLLKYTAQEKRLDQPYILNPVSNDKSQNNQPSGELRQNNKKEESTKTETLPDSQQEELNIQKDRLERLEKEVGNFFTKRFTEVFKRAASGELDTYPHGKRAPFDIIGDCGFSPEEQELINQKEQQFNVG